MTDIELLSEEIKEIESEVFRLKGSMNRQDNGVKLARIKILTRTLERLRSALQRRENAA